MRLNKGGNMGSKIAYLFIGVLVASAFWVHQITIVSGQVDDYYYQSRVDQRMAWNAIEKANEATRQRDECSEIMSNTIKGLGV